MAAREVDHELERHARTVFGLPTIVWVLFLAALAARFAAVLLVGANQWSEETVNAAEHMSLAKSLLAGDGFSFNEAAGYAENGVYEPSSVQSPPYPLLLAGLYWLFGVASSKAHAAAMFINALAGAATVPLLYAMVRRLGGTMAAGVTAAGLIAIWPTQIYAVISVQAITLLTLATIAIVVLWYRAIDTGGVLSWTAFSVIGALAAMTEPVYLPAMFLAGCVILIHKNLAAPLRLRNGAILLVTTICVIGPWTYRNWLVHEKFMPIKSTVWVNIWKGNNPHSGGTDRPPLTEETLALFRERGVDELRQYDYLTDEQRAELSGLRTAEREDVWKRYAKTWISENPWSYVKLARNRLAKTLWWDWDNPKGRDKMYLYPASRGVLLLGSLVGVFLVVRMNWRLGMPAIIIGTSLLTYTLTIAAARFAFPLEPFQMALSAVVILFFLGRRPQPLRRPPAVERWLGNRGKNTGLETN
ncbi:MAG: hypothetical protein AAGK78_04070 [Planctomycetota bacterium]